VEAAPAEKPKKNRSSFEVKITDKFCKG